MAMKVIGIQSSPRGKNSLTLKLLEGTMDGAGEAGAETEIIDITKLKINYCKGCLNCYKTGKCAQQDDFQSVMDKILDADGIVLSSPVYIMNVSAQLKTMLDRMGNTMHEQQFDGKYGCSITTAGGGSDDTVLNIMNTFLTLGGGNVTGSTSYLARNGPQALTEAVQKANMMGKDLAQAIKEKRTYPEQDASHKAWRKQFAYSIMFNKNNWPHNYEHWLGKGWIKT